MDWLAGLFSQSYLTDWEMGFVSLPTKGVITNVIIGPDV